MQQRSFLALPQGISADTDIRQHCVHDWAAQEQDRSLTLPHGLSARPRSLWQQADSAQHVDRDDSTSHLIDFVSCHNNSERTLRAQTHPFGDPLQGINLHTHMPVRTLSQRLRWSRLRFHCRTASCYLFHVQEAGRFCSQGVG